MMQNNKSHIYRQKWNLMKVVLFLFYRIILKHLPDTGDFGPFGKISHDLRSLVCKKLFKSGAKGIGVGRGVDFGNGSNIVLREYSNIGSYALISGSRASVTIGKHVMMGQRCIIILQNHKYLEEGFDGFQGKDVLIGDHCWIGHGVIILPGVKIGRHAIVGAGAVVSKDIPDYAIAVGNPAVVKKIRKPSESHFSTP